MTANIVSLVLLSVALFACDSRTSSGLLDTLPLPLDAAAIGDAPPAPDGDGATISDADGDGEAGEAGPPGGLVEVSGFGSNPGNLKMYTYVPQDMPTSAPLVVVLHGCSQTALDYALTSGWNQLADAKKFYLIYAEQSTANNLTACFNWFLPNDHGRDKGEALSIRQMVKRMKADYFINSARVYATGLSAGGAMTAALMAAYPDLFAAGAIMSGVPFGCATDVASGIACLNGVEKLPFQWGSLVQQAYPGYTGSYPRVILFHGDNDKVISDVNLAELVDQWTYVHAADQVPETNDTVQGHPHQVFEDINKTPVVESFHLKGMGHGIAVDPGTKPGQGGQVGIFAHDANIWSSYEAARFWGL